MSRARKEVIGKRFGRLVVVSEVEPAVYASGNKIRRFRCKCDCGNEVEVRLTSLTSGATSSCGCLRRETTSKNHARNLGHYKGTAITKIRPERKANRDNGLGIKGVTWYPKIKKYRVMIYLRGKTKHIGYYDALEDAIEARKVAEAQYFAPIIREYENEKNH